MEIKDAISLFGFIGKLGVWEGIAFIAITTFIITYFTTKIADSVTEKANSKSRKKIVLVTFTLSIILLSIVVGMSWSNQKCLSDANAIKNYMVSKKRRWMNYQSILNEVYFPKNGAVVKSLHDVNNKKDTAQFNKQFEKLEEVISIYPEEFLVFSRKDSSAYKYIELIDTAAVKMIDNYYKTMIPFYRKEIEDFLKTQPYFKDTITYQQIRNNIDIRVEDYVIDIVLADSSTKQLIPLLKKEGNNTLDAIKYIRYQTSQMDTKFK